MTVQVEEFQQAVGIPVGLHWTYSNFIAREDATTKDRNGEPNTESYGTFEKDGSRVTFGVMCPTTELWQNKVKDIVLGIINDCGADGVYIDQLDGFMTWQFFHDRQVPPGRSSVGGSSPVNIKKTLSLQI